MSAPLPLDGIRVVEFSHMIMGPSCGLVLGDLGADVIKVELTGEERDALFADLERWRVRAPKAFRKLISGRKLWNFQQADLHIWKAAL